MAQVAVRRELAPRGSDDTGVEVSQQVVGRSPWELFWRRFRRDKFAIAGVVIVASWSSLAIARARSSRSDGPRSEPGLLDRARLVRPPDRALRPSSGSASTGRPRPLRPGHLRRADVARSIAFVATGSRATIGVVLGLLAGLLPRQGGHAHLAVIDVVLSLPVLLLALGLAAACGLPARVPRRPDQARARSS